MMSHELQLLLNNVQYPGTELASLWVCSRGSKAHVFYATQPGQSVHQTEEQHLQ